MQNELHTSCTTVNAPEKTQNFVFIPFHIIELRPKKAKPHRISLVQPKGRLQPSDYFPAYHLKQVTSPYLGFLAQKIGAIIALSS